eukprot:7083768-Prymnesium_polylepis.1
MMLKRHDALQLGRRRFPTAARGTAYVFFAEGERTPLLHQSPLPQLRSPYVHRERASLKPHASRECKTLASTFCEADV